MPAFCVCPVESRPTGRRRAGGPVSIPWALRDLNGGPVAHEERRCQTRPSHSPPAPSAWGYPQPPSPTRRPTRPRLPQACPRSPGRPARPGRAPPAPRRAGRPSSSRAPSPMRQEPGPRARCRRPGSGRTAHAARGAPRGRPARPLRLLEPRPRPPRPSRRAALEPVQPRSRAAAADSAQQRPEDRDVHAPPGRARLPGRRALAPWPEAQERRPVHHAPAGRDDDPRRARHGPRDAHGGPAARHRRGHRVRPGHPAPRLR